MIVLPWPHKDLSPNARVHRMAKAKVAKEYRAACRWLAASERIDDMAAQLHLSITFCPPDARHRDLDNMLAAIKAGLDGIADAIGVDDRHWSLSIHRGEQTPGGAVAISIERRERDMTHIADVARRLVERAQQTSMQKDAAE